MPKVTVLIPFYNRASYLGQAIESVLHQTFTDFELLAIDDGSSDDSAAVVSSFADPRIRMLRNKTNLGIPATRNRGAREARGEYLAFLDSDDVALPERLAQQLAFLETHPRHAAVGAWMEWIGESGARTGKIKRKPCTSNQIRAERLFRSGLENSTAMARTQVLREYRHREDMALGSDYDLWARVAADHELAALPQVLVYRREHRQRTSETKLETTKHLRLEIFAWQLRALNVSFTQKDLERHYLLRRMHKEGFSPDNEYVDWAEHWLLELQAANARSGLYPEPAFCAVLGGFWLKTCWNTQGSIQILKRIWTSPLRRAARLAAQREVKSRFTLLN